MIRKDIIKEIILGNQDMDLGFVLKKPGDPDLSLQFRPWCLNPGQPEIS
jgi:hypothetical protein